MPTSKEEAHALLRKVVAEWWSEMGRPLLGSQLKVRMLEKAPGFHERAFQYKTFSAFVRDCPGLAVEVRGTTDFAVAPADQPEAFADHSARIRPHFWRAFVSFPKENEVRAYSRETGLVYIGPPATRPVDAQVVIEPVPKETQLQWRKEFIDSLEGGSELKNLHLTLDGGFKEFTLALQDRPALRRHWHTLLLRKVSSLIRAWAQPLGLNDSAWIDASPAELSADPLRQRIYSLLDDVRTEDLLELEVPIRMLIGYSSKGKKKQP